MGKIKRIRQKYHANLAKSKNDQVMCELSSAATPLVIPKVQNTHSTKLDLSGNIFAGLQIELDKARNAPSVCKADDMDCMSVLSQEPNRDHHTGTSKKHRRKKRHDDFMLKIDAIRAGQRAEKERRKREKTAIVGDVQPMMNALPSLQEVIQSTNVKEGNKKSKKSKGTPKEKEAQKIFMSDIKMFMGVNKDPIFNEDPFEAVNKAVENRISYAQEQT